MIILLSGIFLVGIALAIYAFFPSKQDSEKKGTDESIPLHMPRETTEPKPAEHHDSSAELQQLKNEYKTLQTQLELANNVVKGLREDLVRATAAAATTQDVEQLKKENVQLKDELLKKGLEFDKQLEKIEILEGKAGQLGEQVPKKDYDELNNKFSDASAKIKTLEEQNADLKAAVEAHKAEGEQVPKKDLDDLDKKLSEEISKAEGLQKEKSDAINKVRILEMQIEQYKKEIEKVSVAQAQGAKKPVPEDSVPKKDYEELKKKLEEAEKVLMIVHGAGE